MVVGFCIVCASVSRCVYRSTKRFYYVFCFVSRSLISLCLCFSSFVHSCSFSHFSNTQSHTHAHTHMSHITIERTLTIPVCYLIRLIHTCVYERRCLGCDQQSVSGELRWNSKAKQHTINRLEWKQNSNNFFLYSIDFDAQRVYVVWCDV